MKFWFLFYESRINISAVCPIFFMSCSKNNNRCYVVPTVRFVHSPLYLPTPPTIPCMLTIHHQTNMCAIYLPSSTSFDWLFCFVSFPFCFLTTFVCTFMQLSLLLSLSLSHSFFGHARIRLQSRQYHQFPHVHVVFQLVQKNDPSSAFV